MNYHVKWWGSKKWRDYIWTISKWTNDHGSLLSVSMELVWCGAFSWAHCKSCSLVVNASLGVSRCRKKTKAFVSGESVQVWWEQKASGGLRRFYSEGFAPSVSPSFCLFFSDVGCGARSHWPVLLPLQGSSLNLIYICDANHADALTQQRLNWTAVSGGYSRSQRSVHLPAHDPLRFAKNNTERCLKANRAVVPERVLPDVFIWTARACTPEECAWETIGLLMKVQNHRLNTKCPVNLQANCWGVLLVCLSGLVELVGDRCLFLFDLTKENTSDTHTTIQDFQDSGSEPSL